jgi:hypothetical protein
VWDFPVDDVKSGRTFNLSEGTTNPNLTNLVYALMTTRLPPSRSETQPQHVQQRCTGLGVGISYAIANTSIGECKQFTDNPGAILLV